MGDNSHSIFKLALEPDHCKLGWRVLAPWDRIKHWSHCASVSTLIAASIHFVFCPSINSNSQSCTLSLSFNVYSEQVKHFVLLIFKNMVSLFYSLVSLVYKLHELVLHTFQQCLYSQIFVLTLSVFYRLYLSFYEYNEPNWQTPCLFHFVYTPSQYLSLSSNEHIELSYTLCLLICSIFFFAACLFV